MTYSSDQAVAELANRNTIAELFDLVRNTSAKVANAAPDATSLLYAGTVNGESAVELAKVLALEGSTNLVVVDNSDVGRLLFKSSAFKRKISNAIRTDLTTRVPGFANMSAREQLLLRTVCITPGQVCYHVK